MKIRTIFLAMLIVAALVSTGSLTAFAASGVNQIEGVVSESSSEELLSSAANNLKDMAIGIRDALDSQMDSQSEKVETWANSPAIQQVAKDARKYTLEELYAKWSAVDSRAYDNGEAVGDGNPDNDLSPTASNYLRDLVNKTLFTEIFVTDDRGYVVASSGATSDFDQGPDDWKIMLEDGTPVFEKGNPVEGGEDWYKATNAAPSGTYMSPVTMDPSTNTWGVEISCRIIDPVTTEYLGQVKATFDYGSFIDSFVSTNSLHVWEIKVLDPNGDIVATSMIDKTKVNNPEYNQSTNAYFSGIADGKSTGYSSRSEVDENGEEVYYGFAKSTDVNGNIVVVSKKAYAVNAPILGFIDGVKDDIHTKSADIQKTMWIMGCVVAALIVLAAFFVIRAKVSNPLKKLTDVSNKLSVGDIDGLEFNVSGKDEIGKLGDAFQGVLAAFNLLKDQAEAKEEKAETRETVMR